MEQISHAAHNAVHFGKKVFYANTGMVWKMGEHGFVGWGESLLVSKPTIPFLDTASAAASHLQCLIKATASRLSLFRTDDKKGKWDHLP